MANCNSGIDVLDPFQSIINAVNKGTKTLENQADIIKPLIDTFDSVAAAISIPSPSAILDDALSKFTAEAICASPTDLAPINDLVADCLTEALSAVRKYLREINFNIGNGVSLIDELLALPEYALFTYYQKIWGLADNIKDLIRALDNKVECISDSSYQDQIDDITIRINDVIDDLRLGSDGSFDVDTFVAGLSSDLQDNMKAFDTRSKALQQEIQNGVSSTIDLAQSINPKRLF